MDADQKINRAAEFLPQTSDEELPAVRIGDVLVFVYRQGGVLRVSVDTEDAVQPVEIWMSVNSAVVWPDGNQR